MKRTVILPTWELEIGRITFQGLLKLRVERPHLKKYLGTVARTCHPSYRG
jgi:hypothetical protein